VTADADRPADVREEPDLFCRTCAMGDSCPEHDPQQVDAREVIARALLDLAGARAVLPTAQQADAVLAALSSAGLAVVPAGEQREEWGTRRPDGSVLALGQTREWEEEVVAYEDSRPDGVRGCVVVSRAVYCGPWRPVSPEPEGTGKP